MDIALEQALTGGNPRSLGRGEEVVQVVLAYPERVAELVECVFGTDEIVRMRASDALEKVCRKKPELLRPFIERLLTEVPEIDQPSVQWHLAQMLAQLSLDKDETRRAVKILKRNLSRSDDWIVANLTLESLAKFAGDDATLATEFIGILRKYRRSRYKSLASRASKLLKRFDMQI